MCLVKKIIKCLFKFHYNSFCTATYSWNVVPVVCNECCFVIMLNYSIRNDIIFSVYIYLLQLLMTYLLETLPVYGQASSSRRVARIQFFDCMRRQLVAGTSGWPYGYDSIIFFNVCYP